MYQNIFTTWTKKGPVLHIWDDERGYLVIKHDRYAYAKSATGKHTSIFGDKLKRIRKWDEEEQDNLFEADIHPLV